MREATGVGGAGVQADIKSCEAFGCFSASVITAVTAQNTNGVSNVLAMPASMVKAQFEMVLAELDIDAVKVGMLFNEEIIAVVSAFLRDLRAKKCASCHRPSLRGKVRRKTARRCGDRSAKRAFKTSQVSPRQM